jgi:hypothetical protein
MNLSISLVDITSINTDSSTIQFYYNGMSSSAKYVYYGARSDLSNPAAFKAYVVFNENVPMFSILTIDTKVSKMLEERNKKFYCGIMT